MRRDAEHCTRAALCSVYTRSFVVLEMRRDAVRTQLSVVLETRLRLALCARARSPVSAPHVSYLARCQKSNSTIPARNSPSIQR
ncbi:hypothetical protein NDU88_004507 [Pleurodeles waltl]|uniref:Uncharacterized protein n=1 Tax=Pleurodeles waltl TaxID=8319 RepID=A0AAV7SJ44_PLEWA|nr:hypothetical protein NDU88_004507 [Pleurodeles waltl]